MYERGRWNAVVLLLMVAIGCDRGNAVPVAEAPAEEPNGRGAGEEVTANAGQGADLDREEDACRAVESDWGPQGEVAVRAEQVVDGLEVPWGILFLGGDDMVVTERPGRLRWVKDGELQPEPLAEVDVSSRGEGGMLGLQAHPEFEETGQFYLYLTQQEGGEVRNKVELWQLDRSNPARLRASALRTIVNDIPAARYHNGGRMRIGPDGKLYIATGDAKVPELAQDPRSLAGKLLRVNLDGSVPADNPFGASNPVWVLGLRNLQAFDWPDADTLWLADHGPSGELGRSDHDEINVAERGVNLGWPTIWKCQDQEGMRPPSLHFTEAMPPGGAAVYTGDRIPPWKGSLLVGTLGSKHLHRVQFVPGTRRVQHHEVYFLGEPPEGLGRLREVVMGPDGHLYVTTSNCDGRGSCPPGKDKVLRIVSE